jgi:hypothetical protein
MGQFQCNLTHKCIPLGWICDGEPDCSFSSRMVPDMSDEDPQLCEYLLYVCQGVILAAEILAK